MSDLTRPCVGIPGGSLVDQLRARAAVDPGGIAHIFAADGESWDVSLTYGQLDQAARAVAVQLLNEAVPGDRALLVYRPGLEFNVAFWACLYAGLIAVPVAPPRLRRDQDGTARLRAISANSGARLLLTTRQMGAQVEQQIADDGAFGHLKLVATDEADPSAARSWVPPALDGDSVAYLQYSSGSTGAPKGVVLPHASVLANAEVIGRAARLESGRTGVVWLPTFHDMGLLSAVILPVTHHFAVRQMPPLNFIRRPMDWLQAISDSRASISVAPNFAYELCVRRIQPEQARTLDLSSWRLALCGAEPIHAGTLRAFAERFAEAGFSADAFFPTYGLAEATLMVTGGPFSGGMTTTRVDAQALARGLARSADDDNGGHELVSSGAVIPEMPLTIADPDTLRPLPAGQVGEIMVSAPSVAAGYWNCPAETAETFNVKVPGAGDGFMRTGDLGFVRDGQLYVTGRRKDLIIVDGSNHYPHDIESVAWAVHPALRPGCCAAFQQVGADNTALVLVAEIDRAFSLTDGPAGPADPGSRAVAVAELEASMRAAVSREFALRLDDVVFVKQGTIPLTTSGKIQRFAVAELYRTGRLDAHRALSAARGAVGAEI